MMFNVQDVSRVVIAPNLFSDSGEQNVFYHLKNGQSFRLGYKNTDETQNVYDYFRDNGFVTKPSNWPLVVILEPNS